MLLELANSAPSPRDARRRTRQRELCFALELLDLRRNGVGTALRAAWSDCLNREPVVNQQAFGGPGLDAVQVPTRA